MSGISSRMSTPRPEKVSATAPTLAFAAAEFLGGSAAIRRTVKTEFDVHDVLLNGLPSAALSHLLEQVIELDPEDVLKAVGVSARTVQRRSHRPREALSVEQSSRTWKFAELLAKATRVFGDQVAAEQWLASPAFALGERRPIDLLSTAVGAGLVEQLLGRIEHGVYS